MTGYWERIIDARAIAGNDNQKAGIKSGMRYTNAGWTPPGQTIEKHDRVYIVEGIFHAIALHLAGFKAIAAISCVNFPWDIVESNEGKLVTWVLALDDDKAGRTYKATVLTDFATVTRRAVAENAGKEAPERADTYLAFIQQAVRALQSRSRITAVLL